MNIRGFGNAFGEEQTGNIANVGTDLYFEMLFESLSKVKKNTHAPHTPKKKGTHMHLHKEKVIIVLLLFRLKKTGFYQSPMEMFRYCFSIFFLFYWRVKASYVSMLIIFSFYQLHRSTLNFNKLVIGKMCPLKCCQNSLITDAHFFSTLNLSY
jgi:hypothetical protein